MRLVSNPLKAILGSVLKRVGYEQLSVFYGYLRASGWTRSLRARKPLDAAGQPLPWYSYPFIHFLEHKLQRDWPEGLRVFEFGSGNSTLWWAKKARHVVAVEDNRDWYAYIQNGKPANVTYKLAEGEQDYIAALLAEPDPFQVIIIDGSCRDHCISQALPRLAPDGVLIVDNSDWDSLEQPLRWLEQQGFRKLEFYGLGPMNGHPWGTSVFYRGGNVFGI